MEDSPVCPSFHVSVLGEEVVQHSQCGFQVTVDNVYIKNKNTMLQVGARGPKLASTVLFYPPPTCVSIMLLG